MPGLAQWVKDLGFAVSCGVSCRCSLDLVLLWLWCRLVGIAPIQPLGWECPYANGVALKRPNKQTTIKPKPDILE